MNFIGSMESDCDKKPICYNDWLNAQNKLSLEEKYCFYI